jgi:predicted GIY-YIG superfamily endonuclease
LIQVHYPAVRWYGLQQEPLRDRIRVKTVNEVPTEHWREADGQLPLRHATDPWTIAMCALPHCTGNCQTNAVYVLECLANSNYQHTASYELGLAKQKWVDDVESAERLLYVGVTVDVLNRLNEHLNDPGGDGAHFTTVFPPIRVLNISWYHSYAEAQRAEELTAELLRERFPNDYISQPG